MIITIDKFKKTTTGGSGGNTGGGSGINFKAMGYDNIEISEVNAVINNGLQESINEYNNWDPQRTDANYLFANRGFEYAPAIDTSNVVSMNHMFQDCPNLKYVPKYDTSRVQDMGGMFSGCASLKNVEIDLTGVQQAYAMFAGCNNLQEIKFTGDASSIVDSNEMFMDCPATIKFKDNGTFGSIISAAEQFGNYIETILSKDSATFKYWVKDGQGRYLRYPLLMDKYYALVGDTKYPLIYKGNGKYAVALDGEADMVELHVNGETTTIYTGQDNGTINGEYIVWPEISYSDWGNICTSLSNASYDNGDGRLHVILDGMNNAEVKFKIYLTNYTEPNLGYELGFYNADCWSGMVTFTDLTTYEEQHFEGGYNDYRFFISPQFIQTDENGEHYIKFKLNFMTYHNGYPVQFDFIQLKNFALYYEQNIEDTLDNGDNLIIYDVEGYNSNGNIEIKLDGSEYGTDAYDRVLPMEYYEQDVVDQFGNYKYGANLYGYMCKDWENSKLQLKLTNLNNNLEYKFLTKFGGAFASYKIYYPSNRSMTSFKEHSFQDFEIIRQSESGAYFTTYLSSLGENSSLVLEPGAWILLKNTDDKNIVGYRFSSLNSINAEGGSGYNYSDKLMIYGSYMEGSKLSTTNNMFKPYWTTGLVMLRNISDDTTIRVNYVEYYSDFPECNNITKYSAIGLRIMDTHGMPLNQSHLEGHTFTCNGQNLTAGNDNMWYVDFPSQFINQMNEVGQTFILNFDGTEHTLTQEYNEIWTNIELSLTDLYGNPDDAVSVTFDEFYNAEADTNQWYQLSGNIVCMPVLEIGAIVIQNDAGQYIYIDGTVDSLMEVNNNVFSTFYYNGTYFDGAPITVKTRKMSGYYEAEVNGEMMGFNGGGGGNPPAIFVL